MQKDKPDNVVFSEELGCHVNLLRYATSVGAPVIRVGDVLS